VASDGPNANRLHLTPDGQPWQQLITQFFAGQMLFLTPIKQCQSSEGKKTGQIRPLFEDCSAVYCNSELAVN